MNPISNASTEPSTVQFEETLDRGIPETVRVLVPSEPACRELIGDLIWRVGRRTHVLSNAELVNLARTAETLPDFEVAYGYDRLNTLLRMRPEARPDIEVIGMPVAPGVLLGGAFRLEGSGRWIQLFPFGVAYALSHPATVPGILARQAVEAESLALLGEPALPEPGPEPQLSMAEARPLEPARETDAPVEMKTCPMCAEDVRAAAKICRYCRYEFPS